MHGVALLETLDGPVSFKLSITPATGFLRRKNLCHWNESCGFFNHEHYCRPGLRSALLDFSQVKNLIDLEGEAGKISGILHERLTPRV